MLSQIADIDAARRQRIANKTPFRIGADDADVRGAQTERRAGAQERRGLTAAHQPSLDDGYLPRCAELVDGRGQNDHAID